MLARSSAAAASTGAPPGASTLTVHVSACPGRSLSRKVAKLTLSSLSSHGTKTVWVCVTSWWSRTIVSLTAKPPRCLSSIGISMTAADFPATSVRRSTAVPSRSISK